MEFQKQLDYGGWRIIPKTELQISEYASTFFVC